jgi:hypothetical protein
MHFISEKLLICLCRTSTYGRSTSAQREVIALDFPKTSRNLLQSCEKRNFFFWLVIVDRISDLSQKLSSFKAISLCPRRLLT